MLVRREVKRTEEVLTGWEAIFAGDLSNVINRHLGINELHALTLTSRSCNTAYQFKFDVALLLNAAQKENLRKVETIYKNIIAKYGNDAWVSLLYVIEYALFAGDFTGGAESDTNEKVRINSYLLNRVLKLIPEQHLPAVLADINKYKESGTKYGELLASYKVLINAFRAYKNRLDAEALDAAPALTNDELKELNKDIGRLQSKLPNFGLLWYANCMNDANSTMNRTLLTRQVRIKNGWDEQVNLDTTKLGKTFFMFHDSAKSYAEMLPFQCNLSAADIDSQINGLQFFVNFQELILDNIITQLQERIIANTPPNPKF